MKRIFRTYLTFAAFLATFACSKENRVSENDFRADYEPDREIAEVTVKVISGQVADTTGADIIMTMNGKTCSTQTSLKTGEVFELNLDSSTATGIYVNGINYLATSVSETALTKAIAEKGGKWVLFVSDAIYNPTFIDCIEGFLGNTASYDGPRLYMHTELYSNVGSFNIDQEHILTFTIKGEKK